MKKITLLILFVISLVAGDCSGDIGRMTINEAYKDTGLINQFMGSHKPFVEMKFIDDELKDENLSGWKVIITKNNGDEKEYDLSEACKNNDDYISIELDSSDEIDTANGTTIVLKDADGNYVDWLKIGNGSDVDEEASKCNYDYDNTADGSSQAEVDIYRDPDGTGDWITEANNGFMSMLTSEDGSECDDNTGSAIIVNDDTDKDDGEGCDNPDYSTIKEAVDAIKNGDRDEKTIKVCSNANAKDAYSDVLDLNDDSLKGLTIQRADKEKPYYIVNDDNTPIIIDDVNKVTIKGAVIETKQKGIELKNNIDGFILSDTNITSDKCGVEKIHTDNKFMNNFKMYGGYIEAKNESALCLQDINASGCDNKFFSFRLKTPKFGFNMLDNVTGCAIIGNGNIEADDGAVCSDMNISITHSRGKLNFFKSKNLGIRVGGGAFQFAGISIEIDTSSQTSSSSSCKDDNSNGFGIYIDRDDKDFNYTIEDTALKSDSNGVYIKGNSEAKFSIKDSKFVAKNSAFEVANSTGEWNITNTEFNSSDEYALKITGGDKPFISNVTAISKKGIYFKDVLNMKISGKKSLKKVVATDGDALYFAGNSGNFNIQKLMLKAPNGNGIVFEGSGDKFNLQNNYFLECQKGIYFSGSNNRASSDANLSNNFFMNNQENDIKIDNSNNSFDLTIKNNSFFTKKGKDAIYNSEDDIKVTNNYWGSFPFGDGPSDRDEKGKTTNIEKIDNDTEIESPVVFEKIDYQFDECDDSDPQDTQNPKAIVSAKKYNTTRDDFDVINSSLVFANDSYVDIENVDLDDEVTFLFWIKPKSDGNIIADQDNNLTIKNNRIEFSLHLGDEVKTIKSDSLDSDKWYQVVACYDGEEMKIFIDGELNSSQSATGFIKNYDTNLTIGKGGFEGEIDEIKILRVSICNDDNIKNVYQFEKKRKEYYNQRDRESTSCSAVPTEVDAVDKGADENITTKKVGVDFDLTLKANQKFSGKMYAVVRDNNDKNLSNVDISEWNDETEKNVTITNLKDISREAHIYIKWDDNSSKDDDGEGNSTDKFAVIPTKYVFDVPSEIKAGEVYSIEINATDDNDKNQSYNQVLDSSVDKNSTIVFIHKNGDREDNITLKLEFKNGVANRDDFNITDIGKYSLELNDTDFAKIDKDDTPEKDRTIYGSTEIKVVPYKFKIEIKTDKTSNNRKNLYHSPDYNYTLEANITALDKNGNLLTHFDKNEYATDVNASLKIILTKFDDKDRNLTYITIENGEKSENQLLIKNGSYEINYSIKDSNFTKGRSSNFSFIAYIKKTINNPISPIDLNITELNTTSKTAENEGATIENNVTYLYPKVVTRDIFTTYIDENSSLDIVVYDENRTDAKNRLGIENLLLINWYKVDDTIPVNQDIMRLNSKNSSDKIDINLTYDSNQIEVDNNTTPKTTFGIIHLDTPTYLWYSKFNKKYDYSTNSECINHYCIEYNFKGNSNNQSDVGSGEFVGSEVNNSKDLNQTRHGVRIYR